jgi:5-methyltetrahydrofolate--homocysteine methyltransferase
MASLQDISEALMKGDAEKVKGLVQEKLKDGTSPFEILNNALIAGMTEVGKKFKALEIYVPEVLVSARAMSWGVDALKPAWKGKDVKPLGTVVLGTVKGDLHDIGKNLVVMMMEGAGFKVIDLGINIPVEKFIQAIKEHQPDILGMSALLTTTMGEFKKNIEALKNSGFRDKVKVMVGGAPVSERYALDSGADAYGGDAVEAVEKAKELLLKA